MSINTTNTVQLVNLGMPGFISVGTFGAKGDGSTDDRVPIQDAFDAATNLGGCTVYFPPGTYMVSRNSNNAYCLVVNGNNLRLAGSFRGASIIKAVAGLPAATSVSLIFADTRTNLEFNEMTFDGNWGNAVTQVASTSDNQALPGSGGSSTINVLSTTGFPASGTFTVVLPNSLAQVITYTAKTPTSFTGCTGGTGTMLKGNNVGYSDSQAGLNQGDQSGNPQNYGLFIRGCTDVLIEKCQFQQIYGDCVWVGLSATGNKVIGGNTRIIDCQANMVARQGFTVGNATTDLKIIRCRVENVFSAGFDCEPGGLVSNVEIDNCDFLGWWDPSRVSGQLNVAIGAQGAFMCSPIQGLRVHDCSLVGGILVELAQDVAIYKNRIIQDFFGDAQSAITVSLYGEKVSIEDNYIYSRVANGGGAQVFRQAAITSTFLAGGAQQQQLVAGVSIRNNRINVRNGRHGVFVNMAGATPELVTGTSSTVTTTTLVDSAATWADGQYDGYQVRVGSAIAEILTTTASTKTLTLRALGAGTTTAWGTYLGKATYTPGNVSAYTILGQSGTADVEGNHIDCSNDGNGNGGYGVLIQNGTGEVELAGRVTVNGNRIKNAAGDGGSNKDGIHISSAAASAFNSLELIGNRIFDTQLTPTCTNGIGFSTPTNITKLTMAHNSVDSSMTPHNLTSGVWITNDGSPQQWAGWGAPNGVITANIGSMFQRLDPGGAAALWVKESDNGLNTGWIRLTQPAPVGWTIDPGSGIGVPQNSTEWTNVIAAAGLTGTVSVPDALWLCTEDGTVGHTDLVDSIGAFTMTASGAGLLYGQTVSPWQRKAVGFPVNVTVGWFNNSAGLPDLSVTNATLCAFVDVTNPNNQSGLLMMGTGTNTDTYIGTDNSGNVRGASGANAALGSTLATNVVRPWIIQSNRSGVQCFALTDHDKLTPTFAAGVTGKLIQFGNPQAVGVQKTPASRLLYAWAWLTTTPTPAQMKLILQVLGFVIDWS